MLRKLSTHFRRQWVGCIALFVALGGSAYAVTSLPSNSVGTPQLKNSAVTSPKLKSGAVTATKIGNGAVGPLKLKNGAVTNPKLANGAVNGAKVADNSLTGADVNASTLGTVPSATNAGHALTADSATDAQTLDGLDSTAFPLMGSNSSSPVFLSEQLLRAEQAADLFLGPLTIRTLNTGTPANQFQVCASVGGATANYVAEVNGTRTSASTPSSSGPACDTAHTYSPGTGGNFEIFLKGVVAFGSPIGTTPNYIVIAIR